MSSAPLTPAQYRALAEFRYVVARFLAFSARAAGEVGLEPRQHQALLAIKGWAGTGHPTVKALAERLQLRHNSAVGLVDRLCRGGLVRRRPDPADRRRVALELTARGERLIARLSAAHRAELRKTSPVLRRRLLAAIR